MLMDGKMSGLFAMSLSLGLKEKARAKILSQWENNDESMHTIIIADVSMLIYFTTLQFKMMQTFWIFLV